MNAWMLRADGGDLALLRLEVPTPRPGAGQVLVRMLAAGLNRGEFVPGGLVKAGATKLAGIEGAGEVVALGDGVCGLQPGERVMGRCIGAFAEFALLDAREALPVPATLAIEEAAAVPLAFLVVHDMLLAQARLAAGEWLLVAGVSSGVGVAALQTAKVLGDATGGRGADLVVNAVGGSVFAECVRCMAFEGRLATVGYVDRVLSAEIDLQALHAKRLVLFGVSNKLRDADQRAAAVPAFRAELLPSIADGRIRPLVDRVFAFDELAAARTFMEQDRHVGKIVLRIGE